MSEIISRILSVFEERGSEEYADEVVSQLEHALQCASLAVAENASDELVAAALLHDIGHILGDQDLPADCSANLDDDHETVGHAFLKSHFVEQVSDPVRLHVAAKRYLSTTKPEYTEQLSPASYKSFVDQGGKMSQQELSEFESEPFFKEAIRLRIWDDKGKSLETPDVSVEDFIPQLNAVLLANADQA